MGASVTLWEATAPVKLPTSRGPPPGSSGQGEDTDAARVVFHRRLRPRLTAPGSPAPTYPTQAGAAPSDKLQ